MFPSQRIRILAPRSPLVITAGAYSAADAVGQKLQFSGVCNAEGGSGFIFGITIIDKAQIKAALTLFLFDRDFTAVADNAAFAISDADLEHCVAVIPSGTYKDVAATGSVYTAALAVPIAFEAHSRSLYGQLLATATPTYAAVNDLIVKLHVGNVN